jgi:hypothetical protein
VESKKPSAAIKDDREAAFQVRRYAWSAKLSLSILTNFEEFAVYDCRIKPGKDDPASKARVFYSNHANYAEAWEWITSVFSKNAILKGSFDRFAEQNKSKHGTAEVDDDFLATIESWRLDLARNLALRNSKLTQRELNFAVQRIIDRVIFLRICEDRGIENYGRLLGLAGTQRIYARLCDRFQEADGRYNSGLFHFKKESSRHELPDELTLRLRLDDKLMRDVFLGLYYPDSPYEFSVISADILGQVYEQFLGKVIRLTAGHRAVVEDKPEVKKAGGVYYTPTYVVEYIVRQTVGNLVVGKTPIEVAKLRILDPACGSGSFLINAYQFLLDWHLAWYVKNEPSKWTKGRRQALVQTGQTWRLTIAERKRILIQNIYGVDIDPQAVEVTKLSLLLKVLEGETDQTLQPLLFGLHERALPDLGDNIKSGNSLIESDFYRQGELTFIGDDERQRINVFDWKGKDGFPEIMSTGGFDAVIGNPPWGALLTEPELEYLRQQNRDIIVRMIDSFMYFVRQGSAKLNAHGYFGMILPDVVLYQTDNQKLREFILQRFKIHRILNMGDVFNKVTRPACILVFEAGQAAKQIIEVADFSQITKASKANDMEATSRFVPVAQAKIREVPGFLFLTGNVANYSIWTKVKSVRHERLEALVDEDGIQRGVSPDLKEAFLVDSATAKKVALERHALRKVLTGGRQVKRYYIDYPDLLLIYTQRETDLRQLPNIRAYIDRFKDQITCKEVKDHKHSLYALHRARDERIFLKKRKLIGVITEDEIVLALDEQQTFASDGLYVFGVREGINAHYVMGILNSNLFVFVYRLLALESGRVLAQVKPTILAQLPIRVFDLANREEKAQHDKIVDLVAQRLELQKRSAVASTPPVKTALERQISANDMQINRLVYEVYGLSPEEIRIVEAPPRAPSGRDPPPGRGG